VEEVLQVTWEAVEQDISQAEGVGFKAQRAVPVGGGCINEAVLLEGEGQRFFVKLNNADKAKMFAAEAAGLQVIVDSNTLRAPRPVCQGGDGQRIWLVLEYIEFAAPPADCSELLGQQLAAMHLVTHDSFGWDIDNTIGSTPQHNAPAQDWVSFYREHRLDYQLKLAKKNGAPGQLLDRGDRLLGALPGFFTDYRPRPSLLHGDLWGGNWAADSSGNPVIFDPAVYFGDREADLAMTELFGGFDDRFYQSYRHAWTIDPGYETRKVLYNLYHVLNHFNLFGGGYARQALGMVDRLLAEIS
jgi:fructosamine-3-kinase